MLTILLNTVFVRKYDSEMKSGNLLQRLLSNSTATCKNKFYNSKGNVVQFWEM